MKGKKTSSEDSLRFKQGSWWETCIRLLGQWLSDLGCVSFYLSHLESSRHCATWGENDSLYNPPYLSGASSLLFLGVYLLVFWTPICSATLDHKTTWLLQPLFFYFCSLKIFSQCVWDLCRWNSHFFTWFFLLTNLVISIEKACCSYLSW